MKVVLQRCKESSVEISKKVVGKIDYGFTALIGFTHEDTKDTVDKLIDKIINLRVFEDENGLMNKSLLDINGQILSVSQFTLYANSKKGRRPSFTDALNPTDASLLYDYFNDKLKENNVEVQTGVFREEMLVSIKNDGPVTIILDSKEL